MIVLSVHALFTVLKLNELECCADLGISTVRPERADTEEYLQSAKRTSSYVFTIKQWRHGCVCSDEICEDVLTSQCDTLKSHIAALLPKIPAAAARTSSSANLQSLPSRHSGDHKVHQSRRDEIFHPRLRRAPESWPTSPWRSQSESKCQSSVRTVWR